MFSAKHNFLVSVALCGFLSFVTAVAALRWYGDAVSSAQRTEKDATQTSREKGVVNSQAYFLRAKTMNSLLFYKYICFRLIEMRYYVKYKVKVEARVKFEAK